jgi:hypothetical protein
VLFSAASIVVGVATGLFVVGSTVRTGPLLVRPEVASSSSALLALYASAAASATFALFDMTAYDWSGVLCGLALVVTGSVRLSLNGYVGRTVASVDHGLGHGYYGLCRQ